MSSDPVLLHEPASPSLAATDGPASYRREAWERYRLAAHRFACRPEDPGAAEALEQATLGLRRAAAVAAWRRG